MKLSREQLRRYQDHGHLTLSGLFSGDDIVLALTDAMDWADETLMGLTAEQRRWYLDGGVNDGTALRKLDNPVFHRAVFRDFARRPELLKIVEQVIGADLRVAFSQLFFKPPRGGGPKPIHQDNFYFGCDDPDGMVTVWIALDEARVENGCLYYADGSNKGPVLVHEAPPGEPFNLQIPESEAAAFTMTPAPVPAGGVSLHHGNTMHQSSDNRSDNWRRAVAFHYINGSTHFQTPALPYDADKIVAVT